MTHKLITDEMVEKAFRAARAELPHIDGNVGYVQLRAALEAIADDLIEACAQNAADFIASKHRHLFAKRLRQLKSQGQ